MMVNINKWLTIGQLLSILVILSSCSKEESMVSLNPNAGQSFLNVESEGYVVTLNAEEPADDQEGIWRIYSGANGTFDDVNDPKTVFHGEPGEIYQLGWEVSHGKEYKAETITVSFKPLKANIATEVADTLINNVSVELEAEAARFGANGHWTIVSGEGGRIENADNHIAQFIGREGHDYKLNWTLSFGSKKDIKSVSFHTDTLRADAGINNLDIITAKEASVKYTNLNAFLPAGGTGNWTLLGSTDGEVLANNDASSVFKGTADQTYQLMWTVQVDDYQAADTLEIRFRGQWGMWTDDRDDQSYRFVEINGLEWMADNYNYNSYPYSGGVHPYTEYIRSWYYGQTPRAHIKDGVPVEGEEARKLYGRLYNFYAALFDAPEGWRLPTKEEFLALGGYLSSHGYTADELMVGGKTGLELVYGGSMAYSNNRPEQKDYFSEQGIACYYMTSEYTPEKFEVIGIAFNSNYGGPAQVPMSAFFTGTSVRYVREVTNN
ncbi:FISUMP domain-containing protein [Carboxylicivirga sp. RSCT41]|uniref:FISUMP domain-containing protein n=1 Tax=Carboxylicivirga agarovorans TaxID=3417570 RepID=UPI003D330467